jgi:hypothetical protein
METKLYIGMPCTIVMHSDRHPATLIEIIGKKTIIIQKDLSIRVDKNGLSEMQEYKYEPDPNGSKYRVSLRKDGHWRMSNDGTLVSLGFRNKYHDFSY